MFLILTSTENNYVLGRHLCFTRAEVTLPHGGGGRWGCWGIGGVHSPVKVQPSLRLSVTGIDLNVFSLQRTWCARCSIGPWLHWSMVDPPWTGIFSKNNQQVWQITGGPLSEPRWLVNKVKLQKEHWTFWKKYIILRIRHLWRRNCFFFPQVSWKALFISFIFLLYKFHFT